MGFIRGGPGHRIWYMLGPVTIPLPRPAPFFGQNYKPKAPRLHEPSCSYSRQTFLSQSVGYPTPARPLRAAGLDKPLPVFASRARGTPL
jgi:hypothetical protein